MWSCSLFIRCFFSHFFWRLLQPNWHFLQFFFEKLIVRGIIAVVKVRERANWRTTNLKLTWTDNPCSNRFLKCILVKTKAIRRSLCLFLALLKKRRNRCINLFLIFFLLQGPPPQGGQIKFTIADTLERIKEEFNFLQAQYHT